MFDLAKLIQAAYGGEAAGAMARQFGLSLEQGQKAYEALLPAFAMGLNKTFASPPDFTAFLTTLTQNAQALGSAGNPMAALSKAGLEAGQDMVKRLFGSDDLATAIAGQTARFAGMGQETMQALMPAFAALMAGSLAQPNAAKENPFLQWMSAFAPAPRAPSNPLEAMQAMMNQFAQAANGQSRTADLAANMSALNQSLAGMAKANPFLAPFLPKEPERRPLGEETAAAMSQTFTKMFQAGLDAQEQQLKQLEELFARYGSTATPPSEA